MSTDLSFRILLLILFVGFVAHRGYYSHKYSPTEDTTLKKRESHWVARLANLLSLPALIATFLYIFVPGWMAWGSWPLPIWLRWGGVGIALMGFALLQWSHWTLDKNWSDQPRLIQKQALVTAGPYRWIRHPIYTAFLLILGSTFFLSANWFMGAFWLAAIGLEIMSRIQFEEALLAEHFGEPYRIYTRQTGRLLPRLFHP